MITIQSSNSIIDTTVNDLVSKFAELNKVPELDLSMYYFSGICKNDISSSVQGYTTTIPAKSVWLMIKEKEAHDDFFIEIDGKPIYPDKYGKLVQCIFEIENDDADDEMSSKDKTGFLVDEGFGEEEFVESSMEIVINAIECIENPQIHTIEIITF